MPRSRSRSPRRDRHRDRRKRSRSPYYGNSSRRHRSSRSPRRRPRSKSRSPPPRRPRSPFGRDYRAKPGVRNEEGSWKPPMNAELTLGGSLGVTSKKGKKKKALKQQPVVAADMGDMTDEDKMMQQLMGFQGFDTTKGKKVQGNNQSAINKRVERKYRQYMNRKGGFNRPLDFMP